MNIHYSELDDSPININYNPDLNVDYNPDLNVDYNPDLNVNSVKKINTPDNSFTSNYEKYWENPKKESNIQTKKKKVSFDDILSNMNIVVNKQGVLQFMQPTQTLQEQIYPEQQYQPQYQQQQYQQQQYQPQYQQQYQQPQYQQPYQEYVAQQVAKKKQPLDPALKNSFLYNKYFKDYKDVAVQPEIRVPKTIEEYKNMLLEDRLKRIEQKKRIAEIKSTKLLFTTSTSTSNQNIINSTKNNLRSMNFHT